MVPTDHAPADAAAAAQAGIARRRSGECRACGELRRQILTQTVRQTDRQTDRQTNIHKYI